MREKLQNQHLSSASGMFPEFLHVGMLGTVGHCFIFGIGECFVEPFVATAAEWSASSSSIGLVRVSVQTSDALWACKPRAQPAQCSLGRMRSSLRAIGGLAAQEMSDLLIILFGLFGLWRLWTS